MVAMTSANENSYVTKVLTHVAYPNSSYKNLSLSSLVSLLLSSESSASDGMLCASDSALWDDGGVDNGFTFSVSSVSLRWLLRFARAGRLTRSPRECLS